MEPAEEPAAGIRTLALVVSTTVLLFLAADGSVLAAAGDLDSSFDGDGKVTTAFGGPDDQANAVAIQADGKVVAAGWSDTGPDGYDFALARYNADGTLDSSFDGDGRVTTPVLDSWDFMEHMILQPDSKILAGGYAWNGTDYDFALVRYNTDGTLDSSFDGDGIVTTPFFDSHDEIYALAVQTDGKIVAGGRTAQGAGEADLALARYNTDGTLDSTFDGDGIVTTTLGPDDEHIFGLAILPGGGIAAAGDFNNGANLDFLMALYEPDGDLDPSFGGDGIVTTPIGSSRDRANALVLQGDGKLLAAGEADVAGSKDIALARYNQNGSLDPSFSGDGKVTTPVSGGQDDARGLALASSGNIVVAGRTTGSNSDFVVARYKPDGTLDSSFSGDGKVTTPIGAGPDRANSVAIQADGNIVAAGWSDNPSQPDFALARYQASGDGSPPPPPPPGECTITGTPERDTLVGTAGADTICGLGANDTLKGLGANDTLIGGSGNDTMLGGAGNDSLEGGIGKDTASFTASPAGVTVDLAAGTSTGEGSDTLEAENAVGSGFPDSLTGNGGPNTLTGGNGSDSLIGAAGSDVLKGGGSADTLDGIDGVGGNDKLNGGGTTSDVCNRDPGDTIANCP
ncbi:MAG: hypothetical protein WD276_00135 [Actinomycetota bacterium]